MTMIADLLVLGAWAWDFNLAVAPIALCLNVKPALSGMTLVPCLQEKRSHAPLGFKTRSDAFGS